MDAYLAGLERAHASGIDLAGIHSVASFFVSRVDSEIDKRLAKIGTDEALALKGRAALANARLAYEAYEEVFASARWTVLAPAGANKQRPLWASTVPTFVSRLSISLSTRETKKEATEWTVARSMPAALAFSRPAR